MPFAIWSTLYRQELLKLQEIKAILHSGLTREPNRPCWECFPAGTYRRNHVSHTLPLISGHTHSPQGPEAPSALGEGSQQHKSPMKSLWEQARGRRVTLYCPFLQEPSCSPCAGIPSHSTYSPSKNHSSGPSLGATHCHVWRSRASTSAEFQGQTCADGMGMVTPPCTTLVLLGCRTHRIKKIKTPGLPGVVVHIFVPCIHPQTSERDQACLSCGSCLVQQSGYSLQMRSRSQLYIPSL